MNKEKLEKALDHYKGLKATVETEIGSDLNVDTKELWGTAIEALEFCLQSDHTVEPEPPKAQKAIESLSRSQYGRNMTREEYEIIMDALFKLYRLEEIGGFNE